jgi:hypothetical protein
VCSADGQVLCTEEVCVVPDEGPQTDEGTPPTDEGTPPTDEGTPPTDEGTPPTDEGTPPTDEGTPPTDEGTPPADEGTPPVDEGTPPVDEGTAPVDEGTPPVDEGTPPVDEGTAPVDEGTAPVDEGTAPVDEGTPDDTGAPSTEGDTCDSAIEITSFPYDFMGGDTSVLNQTYDSSSCNIGPLVGSGSPDQVFKIIANQHAIYRITVIPAPSFDPQIYALDGCPDAVGSTCLAHSDSGNSGGAEVLELELLPADEAIFIVDGWNNSSPEDGPYEMHITLHEAVCNDGFDNDGDGFSDCADPDCDDSDQCTELVCDDGVDNDADGVKDCADPDCIENSACVITGGDSCSDPIVISEFPVNGDTSGNSDQSNVSECDGFSTGGSAVAEQVFQFTAPVGGSYTFTLNPITLGFDSYLYVSTGCPLSIGNCVGKSDSFGVESVEVNLAFGDQAWIFVDGYQGGDVGIFTLDMEYEPAELDCIDGVDNDDDTLVDCADSDCTDHPACAPPGATCVDPIVVTSFPVEGDTTGLDYNNTSVESCTGNPTISGEGPELVYSYQASEPGKYTFTVTPNSGWFDSVIYVSTTCPPAAGCAGQQDEPAGVAESVSVTLQTGDWAYIYVDGWSFVSMGSFSLDMSKEDIETACGDGLDNDADGLADCLDPDCGVSIACSADGDKCENALLIDTSSLPGTKLVVTGSTSTSGVYDDYQGQDCKSGLGPNTAPDLVYHFTTPATGHYKFSLDPAGTTFDTIFYASTTCPATLPTCLDGHDTWGMGGEDFSLALATGTEVYLFVDGWGAGSGDFTLNIEGFENTCNDGVDNDGDGYKDCGDTPQGFLDCDTPPDGAVFCGDSDCIDDPFCVVAGDVCFDPITVEAQPSAGNAVTLDGDTTAYNSNYEKCQGFDASTLGGKDGVYFFQAAVPGDYSFSLTAETTNFDSVLYVSSASSCPPTPEQCHGASDVDGNGGESVDVTMTAGQQVLIYVDGAGADKMGAYELKIELAE